MSDYDYDARKAKAEIKIVTKAEIKIVPTWKAAAHIIEIGLANGTYEGKRQAREELQRMAGVADQCVELNNAEAYQLPWGFEIKPSNDDRWTHTMTCNNNFVFNGSLDECFIALGKHLDSLR
mgnify:CR=1 FL=1